MRSALVIAAFAALQTMGCSVVVGGSVNDGCQEDADCAELGFVAATCDTVKKQCVPGGAAACETAAECKALNGGKPSICRADKQCVQLTSEDCADVAGDYEDPNAIVLGFLGPLVGSDASTGIPIANGAKLALNELEKNVVGLPGGPNGASRPLAMVFCHDLDAPEDNPYRAAKHLVNDVKVPAILGPAFSGVTINTAKSVTIAAGVLTISASATSPSITNLADESLVWRTCPSDALQAIPLAGLLSPLEEQVRTEQGLMGGDQIRVAMAVKGDAYGTGLADAVTPLLTFNGKTAASNGENFKRLDYEDPQSTANVDYSMVISSIISFKPQVVVLLGTTEVVVEVFTKIEASWPTVAPIPPKPYYLFPDGGKVAELLAAVGDDDDLRKRLRGTVPGGSSELYNSFKIRYNAFIKEEPLAFADTGYDAVYLLGYSIVSFGDKDLTGKNISDGLKHMSKGTAINAGPGKPINDAFSALQSAGEIDYTGASGPLNFDPKTGEAKANIDIWCVARNAAMQPVFQSSGAFYDAVQGKIAGTYVCE